MTSSPEIHEELAMLYLVQTVLFQAISQHLLPRVVASVSSMALKSPLSTLKTLVSLNFEQGKCVKVKSKKIGGANDAVPHIATATVAKDIIPLLMPTLGAPMGRNPKGMHLPPTIEAFLTGLSLGKPSLRYIPIVLADMSSTGPWIPKIEFQQTA
jgi:hypothetical protein